MFIKLSFIKKQYFIGRESTLIFHRFKGVKLFGFKLQYKIGYDALDILICQTSLMRSHLVKFLPRLNEKINIQVIPNPVNVSNIKSQHGATPEFNFVDGDYIVSAGRLIPEKGFDILISVFAEVKKVYPGLKLLLLGEGKDRTSLTTQIESLGLNDSVALPGFVTNVYPYFNRAKLCVVSSRIEGFPNVLLQMMSQNDKVVSTTCAGDIDAIPGLFLSETHNEESLYKAIIKSLEADTGANRKIFDEFLDERSIESFMDKIDNQLANA
jgi:glycosyltransferase involved in cell wall biosynthesis